jgi:hypothetical protein
MALAVSGTLLNISDRRVPTPSTAIRKIATKQQSSMKKIRAKKAYKCDSNLGLVTGYLEVRRLSAYRQTTLYSYP